MLLQLNKSPSLGGIEGGETKNSLMTWKCPNCGKRVEFSVEQLAETRGVVVCPQCLSSDKVPGYDTPQPQPSNKPQESPKPIRQKTPAMNATPPAHKAKPTPPPHRSKISFSNQSASADTPPAKPKKSGGKKKKSKKSSKGFFAPKSALGCLWRSVVYTLLFLIIYIIFGLLLQGI